MKSVAKDYGKALVLLKWFVKLLHVNHSYNIVSVCMCDVCLKLQRLFGGVC